MEQTLQRYRTVQILMGALIVALMFGTFARFASANPETIPTFADPEFQQTWERFDRPVFFGEVSRSYTWGDKLTDGRQEPYAEGPGGQHLVQYFEKSRMEINNPNGDKNSLFFVTQGLLARDMINGQIQEGDTTFRDAPQGPSQVPFGDLDDMQVSSPTYASFRDVQDDEPVAEGEPVTARIDRFGTVTDDQATATFGVTSAGVFEGTNHSIASVFDTYIRQAGLVFQNGANAQVTELYSPIQQVFGVPITEAYWAMVSAGGTNKTVLIQCFERRCLTFTPSNDTAFQVEMANTGLQYLRYLGQDVTPPTTTTTTTSGTETTTTTSVTTPGTDTTTTGTTTSGNGTTSSATTAATTAGTTIDTTTTTTIDTTTTPPSVGAASR